MSEFLGRVFTDFPDRTERPPFFGRVARGPDPSVTEADR